MKKCSRCKCEKENNVFVIETNKKDGRKELCNECFIQLKQKRSEKRKEKLKTPAGRTAWDQYIILRREFRHTEKGKIKEKQYRENSKHKQQKYHQVYYQNNTEHIKARSIQWTKDNPEKKKQQRNKQNKKRQANIIHNFHDRIRKRLSRVLNEIGLKKESRTQHILGYSAQELFSHLAKYINQLCEDCNLILIKKENCCIDHIIPIGCAKTKEDVIRLNQLENLRLICKSCNLLKVTYDLRLIKGNK